MIRMLGSRGNETPIIGYLRSINDYRGTMGIITPKSGGVTFQLLPAKLEQGKIVLQ